MITIVDYGRGNLFSLEQALLHLGAPCEVTGEAERVLASDGVLLPGVGAFRDGMEELRRRNLIDAIRWSAERGKPVLGICLGMQLLATRSTEFGNHEGLGLLDGVVDRLPEGDETRIPNVGWRLLKPAAGCHLLAELPGTPMVYFLHSYAFYANDPADVALITEFNGHPVTAAVQRGNLMGYQFHPEKSGEVGLALIRRFLEMSTG